MIFVFFFYRFLLDDIQTKLGCPKNYEKKKDDTKGEGAEENKTDNNGDKGRGPQVSGDKAKTEISGDTKAKKKKRAARKE